MEKRNEVIISIISILENIISQVNLDDKIEVCKNVSNLIENSENLNKEFGEGFIDLVGEIKGRIFFFGSVGKSNQDVSFLSINDELNEFKKKLLVYRQ